MERSHDDAVKIAVAMCVLSLVACSSSGGAGTGPLPDGGTGKPPEGGTGSSCSAGCNPDRCYCVDGTAPDTSTSCLAGTCSTGGMSECTMRCSAHGGLASVGPAPNVVSSPECDAFCNRIASLGCADTRCDRYFWCIVPPGQCEASARAALACQAQTEMFMCLDGGGWSGVGGCIPQASMCSGDAGPG